MLFTFDQFGAAAHIRGGFAVVTDAAAAADDDDDLFRYTVVVLHMRNEMHMAVLQVSLCFCVGVIV